MSQASHLMAESVNIFLMSQLVNNLGFVGHTSLCRFFFNNPCLTNVKSILSLEGHRETGHWADTASGYRL